MPSLKWHSGGLELESRVLAACKTLASSKSERACSRLSTVRFPTGPKRSAPDKRTGGRKRHIFNSRSTTRPWSMRPRRFNPVNPRNAGVPWGRLGSVLYTCKRLHRTRRRFKHFWPISLSRPRSKAAFGRGLLPGLSESTRLPHRRRMRHRRLPTTRPTPRGLQEPICPRKKCAIWTRWRPVPRQNVNYPRAPRNRRSGLVGPHTTPPIVNYKYMTSTRREGYFGLPTLGM